MDKFMEIAIREARKGMKKAEGGPFGAVIVRNGEVLSKAHNRVLLTNDPTAHAEIVAIRAASKKLGRFDLSDCEIHTTCEPCPMCMAAIHWAKIKKMYYGCTKEDAEGIGFDDKKIYSSLLKKNHGLKAVHTDEKKCLGLFKEWKELGGKLY